MSELGRQAEVLADDTVELRPWLGRDIGALRAARGSTSEAAEWLGRQQGRPPSVGVSLAVAPIDEDAVGYVGLIKRPRVELGVARVLDDGALAFTAHERVAGIGYWIAPGAQGHGYATRAVGLLSRWALVSGVLIRVEALIEAGNAASIRVVEKCGFRYEGRLRSYLELDGRHVDAVAYSLLASDL